MILKVTYKYILNTKKKNNLTLEDYQQEFSYKGNNGLINVSFNRIAFIFFIFLIIAIIFSLKATFYGFTKVNKKKYTHQIKIIGLLFLIEMEIF